MLKTTSLLCAGLAGLLAVSPSWAQDPAPGYPSRAIRVIVPFPAAIAEKLSQAIAETLAQPEVTKRLADLSAEPIASTPAAMAAVMKEDAERWRAVIRAAGVKPE